MSGSTQQSEDEFISASEEIISGRSVESMITEHPEYNTRVEQMLRVVEAIKDLPTPALSNDAMARLQARTQSAAKQRRDAMATSEPQPPHLTIVRPTPAETPNIVPLPRTRSAKLTSQRALALVAALVLVSLSIIGLLALQNNYTNKPSHLENYTGVIAAIEPTRWILEDNAEMVIDNLTEVHGQPAVGAKMTCLAEKLPGNERYHALEVWILSAPTPQKAGAQGNSVP